MLDQLAQTLDTLGNEVVHYTVEEGLSHHIAGTLRKAGYDFTREFHVDGRSRIDFIVRGEQRLGIEVKLRHPWAALVRQLQRYALTGEFDALILVTTSLRLANQPDSLGGIPLRVVNYGWRQL